MKRYDYLIVGAGLFGAVFAREAMNRGKTCLVVDKCDHVAGNIYTKEVEGIDVHVYGAHIFHTSNKQVWDYVQQYAEFNHYVNTPLANYKGELFNMPFNMHTFYQMWGVTTPAQAQAKIAEQRAVITDEPKNLEEQAISLVGTDIYQKLVKGRKSYLRWILPLHGVWAVLLWFVSCTHGPMAEALLSLADRVLLIPVLLSIGGIVAVYTTLHRVYCYSSKRDATSYTVLGVLFSVTTPFCLWRAAKNW